MSSIVAQFDPATNMDTQFTVPQSSANGALVFFNESNNNLVLTFANGDEMYLPAWYHRHKCGATGSVNVVWDIHQTLSSFSPPVSEVIVESFRQGESFPADGPLVRQTNTGNSIPLSTSATSIANDGNPAGTSVVEATVSGDAASAVTLNNVGQMTLGTASRNGSLSIQNSGGTNSWSVDTSGIEHVRTQQAPGASGIHVTDQLGTENVVMASSSIPGIQLKTGNLLLPNDGSQHISGISFFGPYTVAGAAFFNHNLGVAPDVIMLSIGELHASTLTVTWDKSTITATQVKLQGNGTINNVFGIAIKF